MRMVWIGRNLRDHLVTTTPPLDQVAQSPVQPGLEHCQGGAINSFSGQPVPVPHHPHSKEPLLYV